METPYDKTHIIRKMLKLGMINRDTLARTLATCKGRRIDILRVLVNFAGMSHEDIRNFVRQHFDLPELDLTDIVLNPEVVRLVPYQVAMQHRLIPAFRISDQMHLAVSDPFDFEGIEQVRHYLGAESRIFLAPELQVIKAIYDHRVN